MSTCCKRLLALSAGTPAARLARTDQPGAARRCWTASAVREPPTPTSRRSPPRDFAQTGVSRQASAGTLRRAGRGKRAERAGARKTRWRRWAIAGAQSYGAARTPGAAALSAGAGGHAAAAWMRWCRCGCAAISRRRMLRAAAARCWRSLLLPIAARPRRRCHRSEGGARHAAGLCRSPASPMSTT